MFYQVVFHIPSGPNNNHILKTKAVEYDDASEVVAWLDTLGSNYWFTSPIGNCFMIPVDVMKTCFFEIIQAEV